MGLKQSIVVKNEFTYRLPDGSGTRGSTPGFYVRDYMAREGAGEAVTPVRLFDADDYVTRYMAREEASESALSVSELRSDIKNAQRWGGQAFGYGSVSLSHEGLTGASKDLQRLFEEGKTVMKTVLSFDEQYLKDNGVVSPDFQFTKRGDYRGQVDQMRLRLAIMHGMERMSSAYDDLRYVGVIQVDTAHVHCHLCMADAGVGRLMPDGTQQGKIPAKQIAALRRGLDMSLDQNQMVRHMAADVSYDKRNALCFIKRFTHRSMEQNGLPQFLLACLPEDDKLWRAASNRKEMRKPNALVREYVTEVLSQPGSGYQEAMDSVAAYAKARQEREGLTETQRKRLYDNGRETLIQDSMNGVYAVLRQIPKSDRSVRTPMLDVMSEDFDSLASRVRSGSDQMIEFGFKLRSYSSRLDHHKSERRKYHAAVESYKRTPDPDPASKPLLDFFEFEEEYNAQLMCKYQYFLDFLPPEEEYKKGFDELLDYRAKMHHLSDMMEDKSIVRMRKDSAEDYGLRVYGQHGGSLVRDMPEVLRTRLVRMGESYVKKEGDFKRQLAERGLSLESSEDSLKVSRKKPYEFDDVKSLDIHHLSFDFPVDIQVSRVNAEHFVETARQRSSLYEEAKAYLLATGQRDALKAMPGRDIRLMTQMAEQLAVQPVLPRLHPDPELTVPRSATFRLDRDLNVDMSMAVKAAVQSMQEIGKRELE